MQQIYTDVCVVIITINNCDIIRTCLDSILSAKNIISTIVYVVDDGSNDGTREFLTKEYASRIKIILRDGGHSFSNNNNVVIMNIEAKYYLIANPDIVLSKDGIIKLYNFMERNNDIGACCPKLIYPDGSLQLSCRRFPTPITFFIRRTPIRFFVDKQLRGKKHLMYEYDHNKIMEIDWALGACMMIRGEALKKIGCFDERFRLYVEDIDLCYRLWEAGWSVYYNPNVEVFHKHKGVSDTRLLSRHSLWHYKSMIQYLFKHGLAGFRRPNKKN